MYNLIAAIIFSIYFIDVSRLHKKLNLDFKPFNCLVCLPVWVTILLYLINLPELTQFIIYSFSAGIIAPLLSGVFKYIYYKL